METDTGMHPDTSNRIPISVKKSHPINKYFT